MKRTRHKANGSNGQAASTRTSKGRWPATLNRYLQEVKSAGDYEPRRERRRFHGTDVTGWRGLVHVDDIVGWVENDRLRYYLKRWRARKKDSSLEPSTDEIYEIMVEADREESGERKPFHVERIAASIARNGITDPVILFWNEDGVAELWD